MSWSVTFCLVLFGIVILYQAAHIAALQARIWLLERHAREEAKRLDIAAFLIRQLWRASKGKEPMPWDKDLGSVKGESERQ